MKRCFWFAGSQQSSTEFYSVSCKKWSLWGKKRSILNKLGISCMDFCCKIWSLHRSSIVLVWVFSLKAEFWPGHGCTSLESLRIERPVSKCPISIPTWSETPFMSEKLDKTLSFQYSVLYPLRKLSIYHFRPLCIHRFSGSHFKTASFSCQQSKQAKQGRE